MILNKHKISSHLSKSQDWSNRTFMLALIVTTTILLSLFVSFDSVDCAPSTSGGNNKNSNSNSNNSNNKSTRTGILSQLFRRQTSSGSNSDESNGSSSDSNDEPQTQTELDAQKFMDSLPNVGANNNAPSTFRERMSDTFGLLREGVNNHFRSFRENWSDTLEDLRDTWSSSNSD